MRELGDVCLESGPCMHECLEVFEYQEEGDQGQANQSFEIGFENLGVVSTPLKCF
jgi:hypothetical protein